MLQLKNKIQHWIEIDGNKTALIDDHRQLSYRQLQEEISKAENFLNKNTIAILMHNSIGWCVLDLAISFNQKCAVPLPVFFSDKQLQHAIKDSKIDLIITDDEYRINQLDLPVITKTQLQLCQQKIWLFNIDPGVYSDTADIPQNICKITYTSGSTGTPKGVMLKADTVYNKVRQLALATQLDKHDKVLSLLPLSTLLENIGGLYAALYAGATSVVYSPDKTGIAGSSQINLQKLIQLIQNTNPSGFIIIPQLLRLLLAAVSQGNLLPESIRFIAIGGAPVSEQLLSMAGELNIPVFQGYGLSEACSVVSLNTQECNKPGSVGKVLPCHQLKISKDNEVLIKDNLFAGYLHQQTPLADEYYATGDLGYLDSEGYLYINGRKNNVINTAYGRNISPEWLEKELETIPLVMQAIIYGHARAYVIALVVLQSNEYEEQFIHSLDVLNKNLPDYARIKKYILLPEPFSVQNKQLTGTGRPVRETIIDTYKSIINQQYEGSL